MAAARSGVMAIGVAHGVDSSVLTCNERKKRGQVCREIAFTEWWRVKLKREWWWNEVRETVSVGVMAFCVTDLGGAGVVGSVVRWLECDIFFVSLSKKTEL